MYTKNDLLIDSIFLLQLQLLQIKLSMIGTDIDEETKKEVEEAIKMSKRVMELA